MVRARHPLFFLLVATGHVAMVWVWTTISSPTQPDPPKGVGLMIGTLLIDRIDGPPVRSRLAPNAIALRQLSFSPEEITPPEIPLFEGPPRTRAASVAPQLESSSAPDIRIYASRAELSAGDGATVVLRIEVLVSGEAGEIRVDVSSGRREVDAAAIAYARTQRWTPGRIDGRPEAIWIRWGVHLEG
jgi:TonB family protein